MARQKFAEFKPARRVFAGRGKSMLTFGEWRILGAGLSFGALLGAGWLFPMTVERAPLALAQPLAVSPTAPTAQVAAVAPIPAAAIAEAPAGNEALPQIVLAEEDGRRGRRDPAPDHVGRVARIVDGDTFYLEGLETRIRLWGVDAPERNEEGYDQASDALARLAGARTLSCEEVDIDRYARIVARCFFADGGDLSAKMIESGTAREYVRYTGGYYGSE